MQGSKSQFLRFKFSGGCPGIRLMQHSGGGRPGFLGLLQMLLQGFEAPAVGPCPCRAGLELHYYGLLDLKGTLIYP